MHQVDSSNDHNGSGSGPDMSIRRAQVTRCPVVKCRRAPGVLPQMFEYSSFMRRHSSLFSDAVKPTTVRPRRGFHRICLCFQEDGGPVHAVLGGPKPDADTVAATLCLALHLSQVTPLLTRRAVSVTRAVNTCSVGTSHPLQCISSR